MVFDFSWQCVFSAPNLVLFLYYLLNLKHSGRVLDVGEAAQNSVHFPNTKSFQIFCASRHSQHQQGKGGGGVWAGKTLPQQDAPLLQ